MKLHPAHALGYWILFSITSAQKYQAIKISVYYDAAGNSSADLLTHQVSPSYPILADRMILQLVPYCLGAMQPGSDTYRANVVHACAFCNNTDQKVHLDFATCLMRNARGLITETMVQQCASPLGLPFRAIMECAKGSEGGRQLANNGFATKAVYPVIYELPAVANNDWVNPALQARARGDFLGYVCAFLDTPPPACAARTQR